MDSAQDFSRIWLCVLFGVIWKSSKNRPLGRFGADILARGRFWAKKWSRKKLFCGGMILWWGFRGIPPAQKNSMVPGTHMGRLLSPKPSLFNYFVRISSFPGKLQVTPGSSLWPSLFPLVAALFCPWGECLRWGCPMPCRATAPCAAPRRRLPCRATVCRVPWHRVPWCALLRAVPSQAMPSVPCQI